MSNKGELHIDAALTNVALGHKNDELIADLILPTVPVAKQSDKIYKFGKDSWRLESDIRAPGTVSNRIKSYSVTSDTYYCDNHAVHDKVPVEDLANADPAIDPMVATTEGLVQNQKLRREYVVASELFNISNFSGYTSALAKADRWSPSNYADSSPVEDIDLAKESVRQNRGISANTIVVGASVWNALKRHPDLLAKAGIGYIKGSALTTEQAADVLEVERILVGKAVYDSAAEGADFSSADIWGKYCLVCYVPPKAGLRVPALGYSLRWQVGENGYQVYRELPSILNGHSHIIEVMSYYDDVVIDAGYGYLYSTVID